MGRLVENFGQTIGPHRARAQIRMWQAWRWGVKIQHFGLFIALPCRSPRLLNWSRGMVRGLGSKLRRTGAYASPEVQMVRLFIRSAPWSSTYWDAALSIACRASFWTSAGFPARSAVIGAAISSNIGM